MNKLKTTDVGGFPFKLDDLRWQFGAYEETFKALMSGYGLSSTSVVILGGCARSIVGGTVTIASGYVYINGEIYLVPTHSYAAPSPGQREYWQISESYDPAGAKTFQNTTVHDTYAIRTASLFVDVSGLPLKEYKDTQNIFAAINSRVDSMPLGGIIMWSGTVANIPTGWSICDGTNDTPDLRGRFVIGYDERTTDPGGGVWDSDYNTIGAIGGEKRHTLTGSELPTHQHNLAFDTIDDPGGTFEAIIIPGATEGHSELDPGIRGVSGSKTGTGGQSHENRPPYYVVAYIMKTSSSVPVF